MLDFPLITAHRNGLLFFCLDNTTRSQMAVGFAKFIGPAEIQYYSGGIRPGTMHPMAHKAMKDVGIDISPQLPKDMSSLPLSHIATCVVLGSEEDAPKLPEEINTVVWEIEDPLNIQLHHPDDLIYEFRLVRDQIRTNVSGLF